MSLMYVSVIFSVIGAPSIVIFLMQWDLAQILKPSIASPCVNNTDKEIYKANAFFYRQFSIDLSLSFLLFKKQKPTYYFKFNY